MDSCHSCSSQASAPRPRPIAARQLGSSIGTVLHNTIAAASHVARHTAAVVLSGFRS